MPVRTAVLVLNYNGKTFLEACLTSLGAMDVFKAPGIPKDPHAVDEVWLVDNGSTDESVAFVTKRFPWVRILQLSENLGFSKAYNQAVQTIQAEWIAFLNNDTRVAPNWLTELHALRQRREHARAVASHMLSWDGRHEDFVGGDTFFFGQAWQRHWGAPVGSVVAVEKPLLFGCGGALLVHRTTYLDLGGFDDDYFSFFEDVDLGWRFSLAGHQVWLCPQARVFHRGHGSWGQGYPPRKRVMLECNGLANVYKNWGDERMGVFFLAATALTFFRAWGAYAPPPLEHSPQLTTDSIAHLIACKETADRLESLREKRTQVQASRQRTDEELLPLFGKLVEPPLPEAADYRRIYRRLLQRLQLRDGLPQWDREVNHLALQAATKLLRLAQRAVNETIPASAVLEETSPHKNFPVPLAVTRLGWRMKDRLERFLERGLCLYSLERLGEDFQELEDLWEKETSLTWSWTPPPVSIIVRTQNRPQFLRRAVASIAMQEKPPQEVVVVNDGGEDPRSALRELESVLRLRFVHNPQPLGRSAAADRGLREAAGAFIGFLDDDDEFRPTHVTVLLGAVANGALVAYTDVDIIYEGGEPTSQPIVRGSFAHPFDPIRLLYENYIPISAVLMEKALALEVGGFDTSLSYFEDWDLWLRLAEKTTFVHCPKTTVSYFVRPALGHGTATAGEHRWSPFARVWEKNSRHRSGDTWAAYFSTYVEPLRYELEAMRASRPWQILQRLRRLLGRDKTGRR